MDSGAVIPIASLTSPSERFKCEPLAAVLSAGACVRRQQTAMCGRCLPGLDVAERMALVDPSVDEWLRTSQRRKMIEEARTRVRATPPPTESHRPAVAKLKVICRCGDFVTSKLAAKSPREWAVLCAACRAWERERERRKKPEVRERERQRRRKCAPRRRERLRIYMREYREAKAVMLGLEKGIPAEETLARRAKNRARCAKRARTPSG